MAKSINTQSSLLISLPNEVIELILYSESIDYITLTRLCLVCRRLNTIISSNKIWYMQTRRRWRIWHHCGREIRLKQSDILDLAGVTEWKDVFMNRLIREQTVNSFLDKISHDYLLLDKDNGLVDDSKIENSNLLLGQDYLMETLRELISDEDCDRNLSRKFYASSVYSYFKWKQLLFSLNFVFGEDSSSFCNTMEHISIWLDRWMNPTEDLEYFDYSREFDSMADRAKLQLTDGASEWDIITAIDRVMFTEDGYRVNDNFYSHKNSYLHNVLRTKKGIYITLSVIFQAVASRLGLVLFPVSFPRCFALGYQENASETVGVSPSNRTQFIVFVEGNRVRKVSEQELSILDINQNTLENLSSIGTVTARMLANISLNLIDKESHDSVEECLSYIKSTELLLIFIPQIDRSISQSLFNAYLNLNYNTNKCLNDSGDSYHIQTSFERSTDDIFIEIHTRLPTTAPHVKEYPIGIIVRLNSNNHYGVVCKWSTGPVLSSCIYGVLMDDNRREILYCVHDITPCLSPLETRRINNPLIGKYFSHFNGLYYQPIPIMRKLYPDDEAYMHSLFSNFAEVEFVSEQTI
ncbi:F-box only protein 21-like [Oopsacas minuta]|uniref:F-box only protein 21-like n=1 Tax=Oopsacas minuta TaxID=111878 RepID=A0AAV7JCL6_9METZ|nr:F-box only protein 21-like [Oopsacas minuta]